MIDFEVVKPKYIKTKEKKKLKCETQNPSLPINQYFKTRNTTDIGVNLLVLGDSFSNKYRTF
jgi:hypothetical protein